jgi:hypothetical protein
MWPIWRRSSSRGRLVIVLGSSVSWGSRPVDFPINLAARGLSGQGAGAQPRVSGAIRLNLSQESTPRRGHRPPRRLGTIPRLGKPSRPVVAARRPIGRTQEHRSGTPLRPQAANPRVGNTGDSPIGVIDRRSDACGPVVQVLLIGGL